MSTVWMTTNEAASYMRISKDTLALILANGDLESYQSPSDALKGRHVANTHRRLIHRDDCDRWIRSHPIRPRVA